jgi:two-component sensor histidine kinase
MMPLNPRQKLTIKPPVEPAQTDEGAVAPDALASLPQAYRRLKQQNQLLVDILGIGHLLQRSLNPGTLFQEIVQAIRIALGFEVVMLSLIKENSQELRVRAYTGVDDAGRQMLEGAGVAWEDLALMLQERFRIGRCYFFPAEGFDPADNLHPPAGSARLLAGLNHPWHPEDALFVPIELRPGQMVGVISVGQPADGRRPDQETLQALEVFASQAAAAIENARLYEQVQQDLIERKQAAEELRQLNEALEERVKQRTRELAIINEALQAEIIERKRAEEQIKASLAEKELLLKEIHHRVKNNLQVISSLLNLQAGYVEDQAVREIFQESQHRVRSMALVHEKLYRSDDLARIDLAEYIRNLATFLFGSYRAASGRITLEVEADDVLLGIDAAVPCGLMLNELISNALKHAFPNGRSGLIQVQLRAADTQTLTLIIRDNGIGFPQEFDFNNTTSLGMQLVDTLVQQLDGTLEMQSLNGSEFKITFPNYQKEK